MRGERLTAIDVCAGAGGLSLGLIDAGFDVLGVELDANAVTTHRANVGPCEHADVTTWSPGSPFDLVAGGVPCQSFSQAGDRLGTADPRGLLYRHLIRIAVEANVSAVLLENVEGMLTSYDFDGVTVVRRIESEMRSAGFDPLHQVLCAADYGVPQKRYRLFIVAFRDLAAREAFQWPAPTHAEPVSLFLPPWVTVRQALRLAGTFDVVGGGREQGWQGMRSIDVDAPSPTVNSARNSEKLSPLDEPSPTIKANSSHEGASARASQRPGARLTAALSLLDQPAPTVTAGGTEGGGGAEPFGYQPTREALLAAIEEAGLADRPGTTVAGDPRRVDAGHRARQQSGAVRLSVAQLATLQDFLPGFVFAGNKSSQHKQVGNAVPRRLAAAVGASVARALRVAAEARRAS